jgi:uroporphyrinogen III methyltransferase / synthase
MMPGKVWLVGAGPGDPGLITVRGLEALRGAEVVLHDALSHSLLLEACLPTAEIRDVGKRGGRLSPSQDWITDQLIALAREGKQVVRLKGGDSFLFARGAEEAEALADAGVPFEVVPGLSSPVGTAAYAGIPLTHRDLSSSVTFITGTDRAGVEWSPEAWHRLATATETLCVLMGMRRIREITEALIAGGRSPQTPAAVIMWGARPEQRVLTAPLGVIAERALAEGYRNPAVIVVGEVVALRERLRWYDRNALFGQRVLVPRPAHQALATARALLDRGAAPITYPLIDIEDPPDPSALAAAVTRLGSYDWVLFTSANGVDRAFAAMQRGGVDARAFGSARIGVIGPKTGIALVRRGIVPDVQAEEFKGEGLANALDVSPGQRVLLLRALVARDALPDNLRARGARVEVVPAYQTRTISGPRALALAETLRGSRVDVVLLTSSSTALALASALGAETRTCLANVTVASIGPVTTRMAERLGVPVTVTAEVYTMEGLLDALEAHLASARADVS